MPCCRNLLAASIVVSVSLAAATAAEQTQRPMLSSIQGVLDDELIVATVDDAPILLKEVLSQYSPRLKSLRRQVTPDEFRAAQDQILVRDLSRHVERTLHAQALRDLLTEGQREKLSLHIDELFQKEIEHMLERNGIKSRDAIEQVAARKGTSLEVLRNAFEKQLMMKEFARLPQARGIKLRQRYEVWTILETPESK